jgi:hypothetical protein
MLGRPMEINKKIKIKSMFTKRRDMSSFIGLILFIYLFLIILT